MLSLLSEPPLDHHARAIVEQYFNHQYSLNQRFVILNALAQGAQELAGQGEPQPPAQWPSRMLPPALHRKHLTKAEADSSDQVVLAMEKISHDAIDSGRAQVEAKVPAIVRQRQLRVQQATGGRIQELVANTAIPTPKHVRSTFTQLAAEYFVAPLINRFWTYLREEQRSEERTRATTTGEGTSRLQRPSGSAILLNPILLQQFLATLGILLYHARHSPAFLAILAPDALELVVSLGTRPWNPTADAGDDDEARGWERSQATILTSSLEVAAVILDACLGLDRGQSLGLEHPAVLFAVHEWAKHVFDGLEQGVRIPHGGGQVEAKLRSITAATIVKAEQIMDTWRRSMVTLS